MSSSKEYQQKYYQEHREKMLQREKPYLRIKFDEKFMSAVHNAAEFCDLSIKEFVYRCICEKLQDGGFYKHEGRFYKIDLAEFGKKRIQEKQKPED